MSRSYRRPYAAITGLASAKSDKQLAHRGVRRKHNQALITCIDFEDFLLPHALECPWNNNYIWTRDGAKRFRGYLCRSSQEHDRKYYQKILRK
jgi:hypothetical protein